MFLQKHYGIIMIGLFFGLLFLVVSCAINPVSGGRELMLLSESQEIELGRKTDGQVVSQYGIYEDQKLTDYINGLCQRFGKLSHRPNLNYQFKIVDTATVNAFAVPGGYIYFTHGILAHLNSEAELAGVMGHEMGHITARHSAQQYTRAQFAQVGLGLGMILSETVRNFCGLAQFGVGMLFLRFSRDNERQADDLGVEYASKAGYDASQMASFFDTLERMHNKSLELHKDLGYKKGIAKNYVNLGIVSFNRGDVNSVWNYWNQSLALLEEFSMTSDLEQVKAWLKQLEVREFDILKKNSL